MHIKILESRMSGIVGQKLGRGPIQESAKQEKALPKQQEP